MEQNDVLSLLLRRHPDLWRRVTRTSFNAGDTIAAPGDLIEHVIFPVTGMVAVAVAMDDVFVGAGMIGSEGVVGGSAAFGAERHMSFIIGRLSGFTDLLPASDLIRVAKQDEAISKLCFACEAWLGVQAQQLSACNARHRTSQRFSSWLLRAAGATGADHLFATQDLIADALGVQRASISNIAAEFQKMGLIAYGRGKIRIVDREVLEQQACECHQRLGAHRRSLFGVSS